MIICSFNNSFIFYIYTKELGITKYEEPEPPLKHGIKTGVSSLFPEGVYKTDEDNILKIVNKIQFPIYLVGTEKPVTVYSFQLVSEDNQTFEECNYFKELDCCILEKDAKLLNLFSTMTHESILSNGTSLSNFENRKIIKKEYFLNYLNEINLLKKYVVDIDMELQKLEKD